MKAREVHLAARPVGEPKLTDFAGSDRPIRCIPL